MKNNGRLSAVLHVLIHMAERSGKVTSDDLAKLLATNPVVVRRVMAGLREAGYVRSEKGHGGGWTLVCNLQQVTLRNIYDALGRPTLLAIGNKDRTPECLVEQAVNAALQRAFDDAESLLLSRFGEVTLAMLAADVQARSAHQPGKHHHAFKDPAALAQRWNHAARDAWQCPEQIVSALGTKPGDTIAEIGAGTGYMVAHLSQAVGSSGTVIALDAEAAMVEYLTSQISNLGPAKIIARQASHNDPALPPESIDGALTVDVWHHMTGQAAYAQKVHRALKRGGRFVIVEHLPTAEQGPPQAMRLSPAQVSAHLETAGFWAEVRSETMPRHYLVVGHKD